MLKQTQHNNWEKLVSFDRFPLFMSPTSQEQEKDQFAELAFWYNSETKDIRVHPQPPLDVVYAQAHGSGTVGDSWKLHHKALADFIKDSEVKNVLEVGGGNGILSGHFADLDINWTIIDPNPIVEPRPGLSIRKGFFDSSLELDGIDTVVHSHLLEHIQDTDTFLETVKQLLPDHGQMIFSIPNFDVMLERKYINWLNFEHLHFLGHEQVLHRLTTAGFVIDQIKSYKDDHSVFYRCIKTDVTQPRIDNPSSSNLKPKVLEWYDDQINFALKANLICYQNPESSAWLFGGHVQSQFMLAFGIDQNRIDGILDNDKKKTNLRLYGSGLICFAPEKIVGLEKPIVILRAGTFTEEITNQLRSLNQSVIIIT